MATIKLSQIMRQRQTLSFELFPPKTEKGMANLSETLDRLGIFRPDYMSVTYGAGGANVGTNRVVCQMIADHGVVPVTHFNLIRHTRQTIKEQLDQYLDEGVDHILALRGDFPDGETTTCGDFNYATDLVSFIRQTYGDRFEIAVAGSPEGHVACRSLDADIAALKLKQENGADYIITQLCWDLDQFERWMDKIRKVGVTIPLDVGVMPIVDIKTTVKMALSRNGCVMDRELSRIISKYWIFPDPFDSSPPYQDAAREQKLKDFKKAGIEYTIRQLDRLRMMGIEGLHIYAMNRWKDVDYLIREAGIRTVI